MFNIDDLTDADIGRKVVYRRNHCPPEVGVITSWNHRYVFVRFRGPAGEACDERDLEFELDAAIDAARRE